MVGKKQEQKDQKLINRKFIHLGVNHSPG